MAQRKVGSLVIHVPLSDPELLDDTPRTPAPARHRCARGDQCTGTGIVDRTQQRTGHQLYCSDKCRVAAWREREKQARRRRRALGER